MTDRSLIRDERGVSLALVAISMSVMLGFAALGVETGMWYTIVRHNQSAADMAAISGAMELAEGQSYSDICKLAERDAIQNGFPIAAKWSCPAKSPTNTSQCEPPPLGTLLQGQVCVNNPPLFGKFAGDLTAVEVVLGWQQSTTLASVATGCTNPANEAACKKSPPTDQPVTNVNLYTRAVARAVPPADAVACAIALTTGLNGQPRTGVTIGGGGDVKMPDCGITSDSVSAKSGAYSITFNGTSTSVTAQYFMTPGGVNTNGNATVIGSRYYGSMPDPYSCNPPQFGCIGTIAWPTISGKESTASSVGGTTATNPQVLSPGTFSGPVNLTSGYTTLCPGIYVIDGEDNSSDGAFEVAGNATFVQMGKAGTQYTDNTGKKITCPSTTMANGKPIDGVTIIATSKSGNKAGGFDFTSQATAALSAPTSNPATGIPSGILFAQNPAKADTKPNNNGKEADSAIQSGTNISFTGTMYTPATSVTLQANVNSSCFIIIALTVNINGGAQLAADPTHCVAAGVQPPPEVLIANLAE
jgi:hypothetical protein